MADRGQSLLQRLIDGVGKRFGVDGDYFVRSGSWSVAGDVVQLAIGLVLSILFARLATQEVFGQYQLLMSLAAVLGVFSMRGFDTVVLRDTARGLMGTFNAAARLRLRWSMLAVPAAGGLSWWYLDQGEEAMAAALAAGALLLPLYYVTQSWQQHRRGQKQFAAVARGIIVRSAVSLGVVGAAIVLAGNSVVIIFLAYLLSQLAVNGYLHVQTLREAADDVSHDWRSYGYFLSKTGVVKLIGTHADKLVVGFLFSPAALAVYAIAILLPSNVLLLQKSLLQTAAPKMSDRKNLTFREVGLALASGLVFWLATAAAVVGLVPLLYGETYREAVWLGLIASIAVVFQPATSLLLHYVHVSSRRRSILLANTFSPLVKVVLLLVLGSLWDVHGVAVVFALMSLIWALFVLSGLSIDFADKKVY